MEALSRSFLSLEESIKRVQSNDFILSLPLSLSVSHPLSVFPWKKKEEKTTGRRVRLYLFHVD